MRDPNRIDGILDQIAEIWKQYPDLRLGQLLLNIAPENRLYMMEDEAIMEQLHHIYVKRDYGAAR